MTVGSKFGKDFYSLHHHFLNMNPLSKTLTILLSILLLTCLMTLLIDPCVAPVTVPNNPSVGPEVSAEIHNNPWVMEPGYYTDPYTGEKHQITPGYSMSRGSITLTIKNRPFTPYTDEEGNYINTYYTIWWKFPWAEWNDEYVKVCSRSVYQSDSVYTTYTLTYGVEGIMQLSTDGGDLVDFRVQAVTGGHFYQGVVYEGEGSAFTEFTIRIPLKDEGGISKPNIRPTSIVPSSNPDTSPTSDSNNPPPQNMQQLYLTIIVFFVCIVTVLLGVIVYLLKQRKNSSFNDELACFGEVNIV